MYGKKYWGVRARRSSSTRREIAQVFPKVSPKTHDEQVLAVLADISGAAA